MRRITMCCIAVFINVLSIGIISNAQDDATIVVTAGATEGSSGFNDGECSLTEAILNANNLSGRDRNGQDCQAGSPNDRDTITLSDNVSIRDAFQQLDGNNGLPSITSDIVIEGNGHSISGDISNFRIFHVSLLGHLSLENVVLSNGTANSPGDLGDRGGAIINFGTLLIVDSILRNNVAQRRISSSGLNIAQHQYCGYDSQLVSFQTMSFRANPLTRDSCQVKPRMVNAAISNGGGAIYNSGGTIDVIRTAFSGNSASDSGGAILNDGGNIAISDSTFIGNTVTNPESFDGGGAIYNFASGSLINVSNTDFIGNVGKNGGGILNVFGGVIEISESRFVNNIATASGGGIYNHNGTIVLSDSSLDHNISLGSGGGMFNMVSIDMSIVRSTITNNMAAQGAGLYNVRSEIMITDSTIADNIANSADGGGFYGQGEGEVQIINSTFSGNGARRGAGLFIIEASNVSLLNVTILQNAASDAGDGIYAENGVTTLINSIVGDNFSDNDDCAGEMEGLNNLDSDSTCPDSRVLVIGIDVEEMLQLNEGPTATHALLPDSIAIGTGDQDQCPETDQRGFHRNRCDIGSYEAP